MRADRKCHLCTIPAEHPRKRRSDGCTAAIAGNGKETGERRKRRAERHHIGSPAGDHAAAGTAKSGSGNGSATAANRRTVAEALAFPVLRTPSAGSTGRGHGEDPAAACESGHRVQGSDHGAGQSDR